MRSEDFKGILMAMLIILSLSAPLIFLGNNGSKIVHASPEGGSDNKPIQIKVKIFVLENRVITDNVINARMAEANDALKNSGIQLIRGPTYRGFPGNARSLDNYKKLIQKVENDMKMEKFKGIALIIAPENSIDDNKKILGWAYKGNRASATVADSAGTDMGKKVWVHEIGHVLCLDDLEDNENNVMISYNSCKENGFSQGQMENMKKKAENEKLNITKKENNENRPPCTSAIDSIGDVKDKMTDNLAPDPGGIDILSVNTPFLSLETIGVEIISMSLMGRGENLHLYYGLGLNTDDNLNTGGYFDGFPGVDRIVHIWLDYIFPFKPPTGSSEVWVYNVENDNLTYVGPAEVRTFVLTTKLLDPGPGIRDNAMDGVGTSIPLDLLGPMADNVPANAVAMDLDNWVMDTLTFICETTVPPAPWMSISSRTGKPGDNIQIMGGGFPAESFFDVFVTLALGGTEVEVAHTALDENGKFATTFEVPNLPPDNYFLTAIDNEFNSVFLMFTVEQPWRGTEVTIDPKYQGGLPGVTLNYTVTVKNTGGLEDTYDLTIDDNSSWGPTIWPTSLTVPAGENRTATLNVTIPTNAMGCTSDNIIVTATSRADNTVKDNDSCIAHAIYAWPMFRRGPDHTGYTPVAGPIDNTLAWRYSTAGTVYSSPAVADGRVYVGSYDGKVYCLNAGNGAFIWSYTTGGGVFSSPAVADGKVYVGSGDWYVYCLSADNGALIWRYPTGDDVFSSPAVADGKVYVGSLDRYVYCLSADNGALIWRYPTGSYVGSSPAVAGGKVYVGSHDGYVYCFGSHWEGTATFKLENLYKLNLYKDIWLYEGRKLVVKFYKYDNITLQANSVIEDITPPENVKENENVPHPRAAERFPWGTVQIARLVLTTENENEVISTIASFTVHQSHLRDRDKAILTQWGGHPELWDAFRNEDKDILTLWGSAPP